MARWDRCHKLVQVFGFIAIVRTDNSLGLKQSPKAYLTCTPPDPPSSHEATLFLSRTVHHDDSDVRSFAVFETACLEHFTHGPRFHLHL